MKRNWAVTKRRPQLGGQKGELLLRVGVWGLAHGQTMEQARETNRRLEGMAVPELQHLWDGLRGATAYKPAAAIDGKRATMIVIDDMAPAREARDGVWQRNGPNPTRSSG